MLLTGGTSGIGRVAAHHLAERGWCLITVGRDATAGAALEAATAEAQGSVSFIQVDLADQSAVRRLADTVRSRVGQLDVLLNNAGLSSSTRVTTPDGVGLTMAVNHLAPYLLTHELIDRIIDADGRVITTASGLHQRASLDADDPWFGGSVSGLDAYARSKLANVAFTIELAERLPPGPVANCVHPGFVPGTRLFRDARPWTRTALRLAEVLPFVGMSEAAGVARLVDLATNPQYGQYNGTYSAGDGPVSPADDAVDPVLRRRLWEESADLVGVDPAWP